jgi:hypothetical protein
MEVDRAIYLDSELREPGPGFDRAARAIAAVAAALAEKALAPHHAIAAE